MNAASVPLQALLHEAIGNLPELPDREVFVELQADANHAAVTADQGKLKTALGSILAGLRRELVTSDRLFVRQLTRPFNGAQVHWIAIGDAERIDSLSSAEPETLTTFDEWRGGCGLSLAVARRIIDAHGGRIWSPADETKAAAAILLPLAR
jgi:hypothetical protein